MLCFHGPLIYEAKIQKCQERDHQMKYFIHYHGWNKNWDEWVRRVEVICITCRVTFDLSRCPRPAC